MEQSKNKLLSKLPENEYTTFNDVVLPGNSYYCKRFYSLYNQLFEKVPQVGEIFKPWHAITEN